MLIEPSGGIFCRDDASFSEPQKSGQTRRLAIPEDFDLLGLRVFAICRPETELALLGTNTPTSESSTRGEQR
jgi:hypothetical protein